MEEGEQVCFVRDDVLHVHFKNQVGHGGFASTFQVLLETVNHSEKGWTALIDEAKEDQPCLEGEGFVGKHVFHTLLGQDLAHL